jgi:serine/threonine-protein kinase
LGERVGIGGMAEVYKATDETLGRTVAVKVMLPQYAADPTFAVRFKQEAQSAANLQSPYIVNIYDWGYDEPEESYFIAMEYIRGTDLKTAINQRGAINQRKAAEIGSQVCAALSVAHGYDIIHRDIKPHNIMVQPDGNAKVMDFGIARANGSSMTQTGSVLGTAYYVSPEQAQGKPLTPATDLYSLGIVLYEAVTGRVPFEGPDAVSVALKQVNEEPIPPSEINPDIDPALEAIILRAMAKHPAERYSSADSMRTALNNYLAGRDINTNVADPAARTTILAGSPARARVIDTDDVRPPAAPLSTAVMPPLNRSNEKPLTVGSPNRDAEEKARQRRNAIVIAVIAILVVLAAAGLIWYFIFSGAGKVEVPNVVGLNEDTAVEMLQDVGLKKGEVTEEFSDTVEAGLVIKSDPSYKTKVKEGTEVDLVISKGPEKVPVEVPDLSGMTWEEAKDALEKHNLVAERGEDEHSDSVEQGQVCKQSPAAGKTINEGDTVLVYISLGKETTEVPNVEGMSADDAKYELEKAGFAVEFTEDEYSSTVDYGLVIRQSPSGASLAAKGSTVRLTVSSGVEYVDVPDVTGMPIAQATTEIQNAGLIIDLQYQETNTVSELDRVIWQSPDPNTGVPKGSTVTVYIGKAPATP